MRSLFALTAAVLLAPAASASTEGADAAFVLRCEREMQPLLEVRIHEPSFDIYNTLSSRALSTRSSFGSVGAMTLGLTAVTTRSEVSYDGQALLDRSGARECIAPHVAVDLSYNPLQVYVAREFSALSCPYRAVYAHEMQHVEVYRAHLPRIEREVHAALLERYGKRPLFAAAGQGLDQLGADIDTWLRPLIQSKLATVEALQQALDTPEETFRISHACGGDLARTLASRNF